MSETETKRKWVVEVLGIPWPTPEERPGQAHALMMAYEAATRLDILGDRRDRLLSDGKQQVKDGKDAALAKTVATLREAVVAEEKRLKDKAEYEKGRAALAGDERSATRIADTAGPVKDLKDAYIASRDKTDDHVVKGKFDKALASLPQLKIDVLAAVAARRDAIEKATKTKVDDIKLRLDQNGSGGKPVWKDVGGPEWEQAVSDILDLKVDEEFTEAYDAKNAAVAEAIANDPIVQNGFDKWKAWNRWPVNTKEIKKLMARVVALQSEVLGIDPPTPTDTFTKTSDPGLCGQYSRQDNKLSLNTASPDFKDFRELLDTLTHENTHAYQAKLIKALESGALKPGDPEYNAAMIFALNTNKGYITSDESDQHPKDAYNEQPKEVHAWRAGRLAGKTAFEKIEQAKEKAKQEREQAKKKK